MNTFFKKNIYIKGHTYLFRYFADASDVLPLVPKCQPFPVFACGSE